MTPLLEQYFFNMYKMDYDFGWYDKNQMKDLVVQGFLSPENYQKIVGEDYVAPTAQTESSAQV
ncbi:XkdX family protein [Lactobacillus phage CR28]|nr:XkdX family protein [Lactobacillus phage CR28]